mmetsp:Transcript_21156/g.33969  ORF Transcript_21156/g.33969 Transcript_21156/m.33969 type:complete len:284 (-) Transcript_21156:292-1143(-)
MRRRRPMMRLRHTQRVLHHASVTIHVDRIIDSVAFRIPFFSATQIILFHAHNTMCAMHLRQQCRLLDGCCTRHALRITPSLRMNVHLNRFLALASRHKLLFSALKLTTLFQSQRQLIMYGAYRVSRRRRRRAMCVCNLKRTLKQAVLYRILYSFLIRRMRRHQRQCFIIVAQCDTILKHHLVQRGSTTICATYTQRILRHIAFSIHCADRFPICVFQEISLGMDQITALFHSSRNRGINATHFTWRNTTTIRAMCRHHLHQLLKPSMFLEHRNRVINSIGTEQ